jgi:hypothetical protein
MGVFKNLFGTRADSEAKGGERWGAAPAGCPGSAQISIEASSRPDLGQAPGEISSELRQWPVQLMLVNPQAPYLQGADLLIAADCTAYAYGDFHRKLIKGKVTLIGCPKLDDNELNIRKITEILNENDIKSVTVARMEVPCCGGIVSAVKTAIQNSGKIVPYSEVIITSGGKMVCVN